MAGLDRFSKIVREAARNPKVRSALQSPKVRQVGGRVVDGAAVLAGKVTKGKHQDKIQRAREEARKRLEGRS
ncbi:MAG: hypothetical protein JWO49_305 [Arthrobacter sp.]|nr:hypothetical protein [Arthrobacter sp.]